MPQLTALDVGLWDVGDVGNVEKRRRKYALRRELNQSHLSLLTHPGR